MAAASPVYVSLLGRFAAFYETVAEVKLAAQRGDLERLLQPDTPHAVLSAHDLAARVSAYLLDVLDKQKHEVVASATEAELAIYVRARYAMLALADEIFILDLAWPGAEHWPEYLLEYRIEHSRIAGRRFFDLAQALVDSRAPAPLDADLAGVFLLALQLGFKGRYRGHSGEATIAAFRGKLYKLASQGDLGVARRHAFDEAYKHTVTTDRDNSRTALMPWVRGALYGALGYLVVSSVVWLVLTWSLLDTLQRTAGAAP